MAGTAEREHFLTRSPTPFPPHPLRRHCARRPLRPTVAGPARRALVADGTFPLPPLTPEALEEAICDRRDAPAWIRRGRCGVDRRRGSGTPGGPPLLQFALAELYERRTDGHITAAALHDMGGVGGAVGRRAEDTYQALTPELQAHARELFARLVAPGMGSPDTRREHGSASSPKPARDVAARFVAGTCWLPIAIRATREPVVEVAHEALLTNWPRLREWLNDDRTWIAQLQHLAGASRGLIAGDTDAELYRGSSTGRGVLEAIPER